MAKKDTVEGRAVKIAARVLQAAGCCRYENADMCKRVFPPDEYTCEQCIRNWLLTKARKELKEEV